MKIQINKPKPNEFQTEWFEYAEGVKFLVASSDRPSFGRSLELGNIQIERELQGLRDITDETSVEAKTAFLKSVSFLILDWSGLENADGTPFKYSQENAVLLCTCSDEAIKVVDFVLEKSKGLKEAKEAERKTEVGKSSSTSTNDA